MGATTDMSRSVMPDDLSPRSRTADLAVRLGWIGVGLGLAPWLLIVPLGVYQMDFMLWPWIWPALLGAGGTGAGWLAIRLGDRRARRIALAALGLGLFALVAALAGFSWMLASMCAGRSPMPQ